MLFIMGDGRMVLLVSPSPLVDHVPVVEDVALRQRVGRHQGRRARRGDAEVVHRLRAQELPDGGPQDLAACVFLGVVCFWVGGWGVDWVLGFRVFDTRTRTKHTPTPTHAPSARRE